MSSDTSPDALPRRCFVKEAAAVALGGAATLVPIVSGLVVWTDPLRSGSADGKASFSRITGLESLPADGVPRKFTVIADKQDAWTKTPNVPVGAIYLSRSAKGDVTAFQSICPHAGCFVEFRSAKNEFFCPCHNSSFASDGSINDPKSPSPRPMDTLAVEVRGNEVWVRFETFQAGHREKIPTA